jgi:GDP-mannose transporter
MAAPSEAALMVFLYVLCSSCMLVVNKASMNALPFSYTVTVLQTASSAVLLLVARHCRLLDFPNPSWRVVKSWSGVLAAWVIPILLNMNAIHLVAVETMMMFRSITVVVVAWGDWMFLGSRMCWREFLSCAIISCGGIMYAVGDLWCSLSPSRA